MKELYCHPSLRIQNPKLIKNKTRYVVVRHVQRLSGTQDDTVAAAYLSSCSISMSEMACQASARGKGRETRN